MSAKERGGCGAVWIALVVGFVAVSTWPGPASGASQSINPCPLGPGLATASRGGMTPNAAAPLPVPLNPCPGAEWSATLGTADWEMSVSVDTATNGGYVWLVANGSYDTLTRFDAQGTMLWQKMYNCGGGSGRLSTIRETADGGFAFATSTNGCAVFGGTDAIVYKLDAFGEITWQRAYGTPGTDEPRALVPTSDGGFLLAGLTPDAGGSGDAWVVRLDSAGSILWQRAIGGGEYETLWTGSASADGGFVVGGNQLVARLDAAGNVLWKRNYEGATAIYSIRSLPDGTHIAAGLVGRQTNKAFAMKLDANGAIMWQRSYGAAYGGHGSSITETADGGYLLTWTTIVGKGASANLDIQAAKLDGNGNVQWARTYGGPGSDWACQAECARELGDGFLLIVGATYSFGAGDQDAWLLSLAPDGTVSPTCPAGIGKTAPVSPSNTKFTASSSTLGERISQAFYGSTSATATPNNLALTMQCMSQ